MNTTKDNGSPKRKVLRAGPMNEEGFDSADEDYTYWFNQMKKNTNKGNGQVYLTIYTKINELIEE